MHPVPPKGVCTQHPPKGARTQQAAAALGPCLPSPALPERQSQGLAFGPYAVFITQWVTSQFFPMQVPAGVSKLAFLAESQEL